MVFFRYRTKFSIQKATSRLEIVQHVIGHSHEFIRRLGSPVLRAIAVDDKRLYVAKESHKKKTL